MTRSLLNFLLPALVCALFFPLRAHADTAGRLVGLISVPGLAGYEAPVREAIEMALPSGARVRAEDLGHITLRAGKGTPHTLIVAPLDESGFVVSAATDDGCLRVHRVTTISATRLFTQYYVGQPIVVRTRTGNVAGAPRRLQRTLARLTILPTSRASGASAAPGRGSAGSVTLAWVTWVDGPHGRA